MRILRPLAFVLLALSLAPAALAQQLFYIHTDHLNTPRMVTDGNGTAVWRWDQIEPFGDNSPDEDPDGDGGLGHMPLRFPGQYFDKETGLAYNYFRDYDPAIGRYVESDPIGLAGGINTYSYVGGAPLTAVDPTGELVVAIAPLLPAIGGALAKAGAAVVAVVGLAGGLALGDLITSPAQSSLTDEAEDAGDAAADELERDGVCPPGDGGGSEKCREIARRCNDKCIERWLSSKFAGNESPAWISVCTNRCASRFGCGTHFR